MIITTRAARKFSIEAIGVFCCGLILFTAGLSQQEIIGFESRFYLFAKEMWLHGPSLFPTTYQTPYPDYPVTSTLLIYFVSKLFGHLNKFTAVFPTALAASITLALTYMIGALQSRRWGLYAVCFMLFTNTFIMEARTISPDQYIAMVTTWCFYLAYSASVFRTSLRLWFIPILLAIGFACRGPIGLIVPAGVLSVYYLLDKNFKMFFIMGLGSLLVLIAGSVALFTAAYHVGGMDFVSDVWRLEVAGRLQDASLPWYFYWVESVGAYAVTYPMAIFLVAGVRRHLLKTNMPADLKLMQKLVGWALVILVGLTIPAGKKVRYVLAFTPALALISAYLFVLPPKDKYLIYLRKTIFSICFFLPSLCLLLACIGWIGYTVHEPSSEPQLIFGVTKYLQFNLRIAVLLLLVLQGVCYIYRKKEMIVIAVAALTFVMTYVSIVEPINLALNHTRDFVEKIEKMRHLASAELVFYQENPDALPIKYVANMPRNEMPTFITEPNELSDIDEPAFFIATPRNFSHIPEPIAAHLRVVDRGNLGHERVVVFRKGPAVQAGPTS